MNQWLRVGDYYIPTQNIAALRLNHPVPHNEGTGTQVALWLNGGTLTQPLHQRAPDLVFKGEEAKEIRTAVENGALGPMSTLLETEQPRAAGAGKR